MNEFELLTLFHFIQVFARLAPILVVIPGFGQIAVTPRNRLLIAVAATLLVAPIIPTQLTIEVLDFLKILPILLFDITRYLYTSKFQTVWFGTKSKLFTNDRTSIDNSCCVENKFY